MVVQTTKHQQEIKIDEEQEEKQIDYIEIPSKIPDEIIENDSLLAIEENMNKIEDKVVLTARSLLKITNEMKIQLFEIERLEKTIISMHEYMVRQNNRLEKLEENLEDQQTKQKSKFKIGTGFWGRIFSK